MASGGAPTSPLRAHLMNCRLLAVAPCVPPGAASRNPGVRMLLAEGIHARKPLCQPSSQLGHAWGWHAMARN
eukprot:7752881-Alexandrium_andersonii.AAC.1